MRTIQTYATHHPEALVLAVSLELAAASWKVALHDGRRPVGPAVDNSGHHVKGRQPTDPESNCVTVDRSGLPRKLEVPQQWRTALPQGVEVGGLVVRGSGLPAPVQDPDPLERQGSDSSLVRTAPRTLLPIVGAGPELPVDRLCRPLHERLAQELRALPAPVEGRRPAGPGTMRSQVAYSSSDTARMTSSAWRPAT